MRRRNRAVIAVVAVAITLAAGCGRSSGGGDTQAKAVGGGKATGTVTVWAMGTEGEKLAAFAKDFTAENPGATVNVTAVPWDAAHQKIASAIAARQTPDVSMIGTTWQGEFAKSGALDPTPSDVASAGAFFPGAWDTTKVGGTAYGVPWYVETRVLYYRTDIARKAGITAAPKTWADLTAMATAMQAKGGAKWGIYLQPGKTGSWQTLMPFAWSNGASITDGTNYTFDSPQMTQALQYYQSFFTKKLSPTDLPNGELEPDFGKGSIGAFVSGPWEGALVDQLGAKGKYAVAPLPAGQSSTSFIGGSNIAVFKDAKNRDGAWKFVQWLSRPDVQVKWYKAVGDLPAVQSAWQEPALSGDTTLTTFGQQLKSAKAPPSFPTWEQVAAVLDTEVEKVANGKEDAAAALRSVQSQASSIGSGA